MQNEPTILTTYIDYARCPGCGTVLVPGTFTTTASRKDETGHRYKQIRCRDCNTTGRLYERPQKATQRVAIRRQKLARTSESK